MPLVMEDVRHLASVVTVDAIKDIPNADAIKAATVKGWTVVIKNDEFKVGDKVVYFEEDSALPVSDPRFAFLAPRGTKTVDGEKVHILKIARLRGIYSQGLLLPLDLFEDQVYHWAVNECLASSTDPVWTPPVGMDLTAALNVRKWEAPVEVKNGQTVGTFLTNYVSKTDAERVQNISDALWMELSQEEWIPTEKVDGTSLTVIRDNEGDLRVCSRNLEIKDGDNLYWNIVRQFRLGDLVPNNGEVIQCEIAGDGIQKNRQGIKGVRPFVFNVVKDRVPVPRAMWSEGQLALSVPVLDLPFPKSQAEALEQVDGIKSTLDKNRLSEGVVWHSASGREFNGLGNRSVWKAVSQKYLTKE